MTQAPARRPLRASIILGPLASRPRLAIAVAAGLAVWLVCAFGPISMRWSTAAIAGWDFTCLIFTVAILGTMKGCGPDNIRARSAAEDEGAGFILGLVVVAAAASLGAVAAELDLAKHAAGLERAVRVTLVFATVAASWFVVQLIFCIHYAHAYYLADDLGEGGLAGGLRFPGGEAPDYWDFLHFSVIIGVACQTADIEFTSKPLRRVGTLHGVVAFTFNTVVLALSINLLAGLF